MTGNNTNKKRMSTAMLAKLAMMIAISCVLVLLIRIPFPPAPFLVYDPADIPIYIATFAFGPVAGLVVTLIVSLIQAFALGGDGVYGFIMHFAATGMFALVAGLIYSKHKTKKNAVVAIIAGILVMTLVMCVANYFVTSAFMGVPKQAIVAMLPTVVIPFNLLKGGINGFVTFLIYKRISGFLHKN